MKNLKLEQLFNKYKILFEWLEWDIVDNPDLQLDFILEYWFIPKETIVPSIATDNQFLRIYTHNINNDYIKVYNGVNQDNISFYELIVKIPIFILDEIISNDEYVKDYIEKRNIFLNLLAIFQEFLKMNKNLKLDMNISEVKYKLMSYAITWKVFGWNKFIFNKLTNFNWKDKDIEKKIKQELSINEILKFMWYIN